MSVGNEGKRRTSYIRHRDKMNSLESKINFFVLSSFLIFSLVLGFMLFLDFVVLGVL